MTFALDIDLSRYEISESPTSHLDAFTSIKRVATLLVLKENATFKCNIVLIAKKQLLSFFKDIKKGIASNKILCIVYLHTDGAKCSAFFQVFLSYTSHYMYSFRCKHNS